MQTLIWIKSPSWVWSSESSFCLFLVNVTDLSASVAQKPLEAICSIFPPPQLEVFPHSLCRLKWSGSQIITVVECHHAACPTPTLMCVCVHVWTRGPSLKPTRGRKRESKRRGGRRERAQTSHRVVQKPRGSLFWSGQPVFYFLFLRKAENIWVWWWGLFKDMRLSIFSRFVSGSSVQASPRREQSQPPEDPKEKKKQTECERNSIKVFSNNWSLGVNRIQRGNHKANKSRK